MNLPGAASGLGLLASRPDGQPRTEVVNAAADHGQRTDVVGILAAGGHEDHLATWQAASTARPLAAACLIPGVRLVLMHPGVGGCPRAYRLADVLPGQRVSGCPSVHALVPRLLGVQVPPYNATPAPERLMERSGWPITLHTPSRASKPRATKSAIGMPIKLPQLNRACACRPAPPSFSRTPRTPRTPRPPTLNPPHPPGDSSNNGPPLL